MVKRFKVPKPGSFWKSRVEAGKEIQVTTYAPARTGDTVDEVVVYKEDDDAQPGERVKKAVALESFYRRFEELDDIDQGLAALRWVSICLLLALGGASAYGIARADSQVPRERCAQRIASLANPNLMSRQTALRKARVICHDLERDDRYFFKAVTQ